MHKHLLLIMILISFKCCCRLFFLHAKSVAFSKHEPLILQSSHAHISIHQDSMRDAPTDVINKEYDWLGSENPLQPIFFLHFSHCNFYKTGLCLRIRSLLSSVYKYTLENTEEQSNIILYSLDTIYNVLE
jgi:hypothetical protein